ncbi:MAG: (Fe-S)-binding protein [Candidatus Electryonea clarkiae]|nr:(Fe-S)-binding protein [Candidatus Electryonea clarkiae]
MAVPIKHILGILVDNLSIRGSVLPLSKSRSTGWAKGLDIPMGGKTVIYTGHMYQLIPSITAMEKMTSKFANSWISKYYGIGRMVNKVINISRFMTWTNANERAKFDGMLRNIALLLKTAEVDFGYLYGEELYTGTLVYDEGINDVFEYHAHKVYERIKKHNVERVITVDPHTTDMLKSVYPKIIKDYQLEVKSYLEVLAESNLKPLKTLEQDIVIHDSCVYARYEGIIDQPRQLLENAGAKIIEPINSRKMTYCCGGPVESLFPIKARTVADSRVEQLTSAGDSSVTMCPICYINLKAAAENNGLSVKDISDYLVEAYCDRNNSV